MPRAPSSARHLPTARFLLPFVCVHPPLHFTTHPKASMRRDLLAGCQAQLHPVARDGDDPESCLRCTGRWHPRHLPRPRPPKSAQTLPENQSGRLQAGVQLSAGNLVTRSHRTQGNSECVGAGSSLGVETARFLMFKDQLSPFAKTPRRRFTDHSQSSLVSSPLESPLL